MKSAARHCSHIFREILVGLVDKAWVIRTNRAGYSRAFILAPTDTRSDHTACSTGWRGRELPAGPSQGWRLSCENIPSVAGHSDWLRWIKGLPNQPKIYFFTAGWLVLSVLATPAPAAGTDRMSSLIRDQYLQLVI